MACSYLEVEDNRLPALERFLADFLEIGLRLGRE
jgi:hypothetical protein